LRSRSADRAAGEVRDVGAEDEVPYPDRLVAGGVPGSAEEFDRAVAEVARDRRAIVTSIPLRALNDDGHRHRDRLQPADMVVQFAS
jgi:hypothetical protein